MSNNDKLKLIPEVTPEQEPATTAIEPQPEAVSGTTTAQGDAPPESQESLAQLQVVVQDKQVVMQFERSVRWIALTPEQAVILSQALVHCAQFAHGQQLIVVPGK